MSDKKFINGLVVKRHEKAPEFVIANLSFKVADFIKELNELEKNGWVNVDVKLSKIGKYYAELNTWEKGQGKTTDAEDRAYDKKADKEAEIEYPTEEINPEDIPF